MLITNSYTSQITAKNETNGQIFNHAEALRYERVGYYNHKLSPAAQCTFQLAFKSCWSFKIMWSRYSDFIDKKEISKK